MKERFIALAENRLYQHLKVVKLDEGWVSSNIWLEPEECTSISSVSSVLAAVSHSAKTGRVAGALCIVHIKAMACKNAHG